MKEICMYFIAVVVLCDLNMTKEDKEHVTTLLIL